MLLFLLLLITSVLTLELIPIKNEIILNHNTFIVSYNTTLDLPNYSVHKFIQKYKRCSNSFKRDCLNKECTLKSRQAKYLTNLKQERGHLVPAIDVINCIDTFYTSNTVPQYKFHNSPIWAYIENYVRKKYTGINYDHITAPEYGNEIILDHYGNKLNIPIGLYKIIFKGKDIVWSIYIPNNENIEEIYKKCDRNNFSCYGNLTKLPYFIKSDNKLSLQLTVNICKYKDCNNVKNYFTIHGLWPTKDFCDTSYNFYINDKLKKELQLKWISIFNDDNKFWEYEWKKHGSCTGYNPSEYFDKTLKLYNNLDFNKNLNKIVKKFGKQYTSNDFRKYLSEYYPKVKLNCKNNLFEEIRFCYNNDYQLIDCYDNTTCDIDLESFEYYDNNSNIYIITIIGCIFSLLIIILIIVFILLLIYKLMILSRTPLHRLEDN